MSQCLQKKLSMTLKLDGVPRYFIKKVPTVPVLKKYRGTFVHGTAHLWLLMLYLHVLADLHVHIKLYNKESTTPLKKVTKILTVCEVLNKKPTSKKCLPEIHKLLQIYFSIALVSASAERSFRVMRRIKTSFRSPMTDNSLNN